MNINTVKELEETYLVNGSISIPKDSGNRHYKSIQDWIEDGGIVEQEDLLQKAKEVKCAEICAKRNEKILEDSFRYTEAKMGEDEIMALSDLSDVEEYDIEGKFS